MAFDLKATKAAKVADPKTRMMLHLASGCEKDGWLQLSSPALSAQTAPRPKRLHGAGLAWPSISRRRKLPRWPTPRRE